ncbi:hypothetical protein E8E12_009526 [Didymella heteroderae]|uniref:DUF6606 domain-containing protein n=1 Tax=Didymella heteroderae TaxID=1769908 RepID=A0A9P4WVV3_9PLEO|nr:hypothetical protein E8E12_009526 [Didymella heteroderae]
MAPPESQNTPPTVEAIAYLIHHVVLPRKLPQVNDYNAAHEQLLLQTTLQALHDLKDVVRGEHLGDVSSAIAGIDMSMRSRDNEGNVSEVQLHDLLSELVQVEQANFLPLEVRAQNAGVLISRTADQVIFEFFELAPLNEASMRQGRLTRTFPGLAASIALTKFKEDDLIQSLSRTISKMSSQAAPGFQPQTRKAGHFHHEIRDTTHPGMVADYFMNIITAVGQASQPTRITKNTREEVMWKGSLLPWRRSTLWLLIRVTLQLHFTRKCSSFKSPDSFYKIFMALLVTRIVNLATPHYSELHGDLLHAAVSKLLWWYNKIESMDQFDGLRLTWANAIVDAFKNAHRKMSSSWQSIARSHNADISLEKLGLLRPEDDIDLKLNSLDEYLSGIADRRPVAPNGKFKPTSTHRQLPARDLPRDFKAASNDSDFGLLAVENKFGPDIDLKAAQCLLLPFKSQMIRLANVESYLASRLEGVSDAAPPVDQDFGDESSFAVQYFEQSAIMQAAKLQIEQEAAVERQEKLEEFMQRKLEYQGIVREYEAMTCNEVILKAESLKIEVFEWPLSPDPAIAKATVFETFIPDAFAAWRDICAYIAQNVLGFRGEVSHKPSVKYTLNGHPERTELYSRATEISLLCTSNFDIEEKYLAQLLVCIPSKVSRDMTALPQPHEQWVWTMSGSLPVHFNLLTAELLVNGLPLSRLPSDYMAHALYKPLFGGCNLEVGPSEEPGMSFSSKYAYQDYQLHFGMTGSDLSLVAIKGTSPYDLIPSNVFSHCLPEDFIFEYYYCIDQTLERLVDTGDLQRKLLLAYLHALTYSNMPDSPTHQTGTERALELLHTPAVLSFGPLTSANIQMLFLIAKLSPAGHFYPHYLKEMQMISWDQNLSSTSQHGLFSIRVRDLFDQARKEKVFYQNTSFAEPTKE